MNNPSEYSKKVILKFMQEHPYINIQGIDPGLIHEFLVQPYVQKQSLEMQVDLLRDYILANDLTEVQLWKNIKTFKNLRERRYTG